MRTVRAFLSFGLLLTVLACGVKGDPLPPRDDPRPPADGAGETAAAKKKKES